MMKYAAFLRAVNVGGRTIKMDLLRTYFENLGYSNVATYIQSGNVIFESASRSAAKLEAEIERELQKKMGYQVTTFLRTLPELGKVVESAGFAGEVAEDARLYVAFLKDTPPAALQKELLKLCSDGDVFHFAARELYWLRHPRPGVPFTSGFIEKILKAPATVRNITTVSKMASSSR